MRVSSAQPIIAAPRGQQPRSILQLIVLALNKRRIPGRLSTLSNRSLVAVLRLKKSLHAQSESEPTRRGSASKGCLILLALCLATNSQRLATSVEDVLLPLARFPWDIGKCDRTGIVAPMLIKGPTTENRSPLITNGPYSPLEATVGDVSFQKGAGVKDASEAGAAELRYLPQYWPDLNPVEPDFIP
jgi:hypothetical protein